MTNYAKQTWADDDPTKPPSAARFNFMEQGIYDAHFQPAVEVWHSVHQSLANSTEAVLGFDSEIFDTDAIHDPGINSRLTCKTSGVYLVEFGIEFAVNATGQRYVYIRKNGTANVASAFRAALPTFQTSVEKVKLLNLAVNDYLELVVFQNSGGALNVESSGNSRAPYFGMVRVA
jgi:hypothetical protein